MDNDQTDFYETEIQALLRAMRGESHEEDLVDGNRPGISNSQPNRNSSRSPDHYRWDSNGAQAGSYDHGEDPVEFEYQPSGPIFQSRNSNRPQEQRHAGSPGGGRSRLHSQQGLYQSQSHRPLDKFLYSKTDVPLDDYDRRLLSETVGGRGNFSNAVRDPPKPHTGRREPSPIRDTAQPFHSYFQNFNRPTLAPTQSFLPPFQNPPTPTISTFSSPLTLPASSPSFNVSQRRAARDPHRAFNQNRSFASSRPTENGRTKTQRIDVDHAPPMVQGIQLISLNNMPDRFRSIFPFPLFNAIQSKCYESVYMSDNNLVVSAPTGGGKTAILELSICRLIFSSRSDQYKIIYMAPTKSLCSERQRDWGSKFASLDLKCAELTGDTDQTQIRDVRNASIIITTPEKWDSITRKWKDHGRLMELVRLFLIDEVHILKDNRGATLEAVVSRMKSVGSNVRFVALSATVPNSSDVAKWLGKDPTNQKLPAHEERFGEEFRPVKLQKFVYGLPYRGNEFGFEGACDPKLPGIIAKYTQKKPMMIFCVTRNSTISTAKLLANLWATKDSRDRLWPRPSQRIDVKDPDLRNTLTSGVAFHHAGLHLGDRHAVERGFLEGAIFVICCTSTLAVGVNLPCNMVIIKNTVNYQGAVLKEYTDLEIMQMLGRAGRPQFDDSAIAVIITSQEKVQKYEKLVTGEEMLESCLHLNLIDHLNAEVGLGTIYDIPTAKRWLAGTFLFVRLEKNPGHYKLGDNDTLNQLLDDRIEKICQRDVGLLLDKQLISSNGRLKSTEFGDAMARYYVKFGTMLTLLRLEPRSKISDILSVLAEAEEYHEIRFRSGEKPLFREINKANGMKFPIKVDLSKPAHKCSLIMQAELGGVEFPTDEAYMKHKKQYLQDKEIIFTHVQRLIKCVIDCKIHLQDAVGVRHALELLRSFGGRVWDNSPYQLKQVAQIGPVAIRKLVMGGINSVEALEIAGAQRIELLLSRNPPFGNNTLANLKNFPKLRVTVKMMGKESKPRRPVNVKIKATCGFLNERVPIYYNRKPLFVCLLVERSDGHLIEFRRISARRLDNSQDMFISAEVTHHTQYITFYIMCDEIAGSMRSAELKPGLPASMFPVSLTEKSRSHSSQTEKHNGTVSTCDRQKKKYPISDCPRVDEFLDSEIDDQDMIEAVDDMDFSHIDDFDTGLTSQTSEASLQSPIQDGISAEECATVWNPKQLENGKWACNHKCKDKSACKHLCCRDGLEKAPKPPKNPPVSVPSPQRPGAKVKKTAPRPRLAKNPSLQQGGSNKSERDKNIETLDLSHGRDPDEHSMIGPGDYRKLHRLHGSVSKGPAVPIMSRPKKITASKKAENSHISSSTCGLENSNPNTRASSDYDWGWMDDLPSPSEILGRKRKSAETLSTAVLNHHDSERLDFEDDFELEDSQTNRLASVDDNPRTTAATESLVGDIDEGSKAFEGFPILSIAKPNLDQVSPIKSNDHLFLATSSPNESAVLPAKHKTSDEQGTLQDNKNTKRRRFNTLSADGIFQPSTVVGNQSPSPVQALGPVVKESGCPRPEWVDDFDPEFIAEYADFVEFI